MSRIISDKFKLLAYKRGGMQMGTVLLCILVGMRHSSDAMGGRFFIASKRMQWGCKWGRFFFAS
ncbi:exported hypothetical protein [Candidatus Desulfosporosinus infrequens]|uniref:Uncharacterized protein n=1 Tax=Candidatus Desulfosporosinus infrequens TaxID=2043169 RepID=A0A2U3L2R8_9FIRM|nr:exported hypothetical protein [Candidatus Desulfosporosinus infrequens]